MICVGVIERSDLVGTVYCTLLFVTPENGLEIKRRKVRRSPVATRMAIHCSLQLMPTGAERLIWGFGGAEDVKGKILETTFVKSKLSAKLSGTSVEFYHVLYGRTAPIRSTR